MSNADPLAPVRCSCGAYYDSASVTVIARYADCSVWKAPCCGRQTDDRTWVSGANQRVSVDEYNGRMRCVDADKYGRYWSRRK